jgi:hypothetical protein
MEHITINVNYDKIRNNTVNTTNTTNNIGFLKKIQIKKLPRKKEVSALAAIYQYLKIE